MSKGCRESGGMHASAMLGCWTRGLDSLTVLPQRMVTLRRATFGASN